MTVRVINVLDYSMRVEHEHSSILTILRRCGLFAVELFEWVQSSCTLSESVFVHLNPAKRLTQFACFTVRARHSSIATNSEADANSVCILRNLSCKIHTHFLVLQESHCDEKLVSGVKQALLISRYAYRTLRCGALNRNIHIICVLHDFECGGSSIFPRHP